MFNTSQSRMSIENKLNINFNSTRQLKNEDWLTMIIKRLSCTFFKNVCVLMWQFVNRETNTRLKLNVNALSCDMININDVFCRIQVHSFHTIVVSMINSDKIFQRQMIEIHKLYKKNVVDEKNFFLIALWR